MRTPTPSAIKQGYIKNHPEGHFFCRNTMSFFGDTMANFEVLDYDNNHWHLVRKQPTAVTGTYRGKGWLFDKITYAVRPL